MSETKFAPYTATEAVKRAKDRVGDAAFSGMCQAFTVTMFGTGAVGDFDRDRDADAVDGWKAAKKKVLIKNISSYDRIPAGVMLYWSGGSKGYGHAAVSIGGGKMVTTDYRNGRIGIANIKGWWAGSHKFLGYVTIEGNGHTLRDPIKKHFARFGTYNIAWDNPEYQKQIDKRIVLITNSQLSYKCNLMALQERPNKYGNKMDARLAAKRKAGDNPTNIRKAAGASGRYNYVGGPTGTSLKVSNTPPHKLDDREKPFTVSEHTIQGEKILYVNGHPQHGSSASQKRIRDLQTDYIISYIFKLASKRKIPRSHIFWAGDWQDTGMKKKLAKYGYSDAFDVADKTVNKKYKSYNKGSKEKLVGTRIDYICLDNDVWKVSQAKQLWLLRSDHNPQIVDVYRIV